MITAGIIGAHLVILAGLIWRDPSKLGPRHNRPNPTDNQE